MSIDRAHALEPDHPHLAEGAAEIDPLADRVKRLRNAREGLRTCKEVADDCRDEIGAYLDEREAEVATVNNVPVLRWHPVTTSKVSIKLLQEKYPEIAEECTVETTSYRLDFI